MEFRGKYNEKIGRAHCKVFFSSKRTPKVGPKIFSTFFDGFQIQKSGFDYLWYKKKNYPKNSSKRTKR